MSRRRGGVIYALARASARASSRARALTSDRRSAVVYLASQKPDRKVSKAFIFFLEGINAAKNLRSGVNEG